MEDTWFPVNSWVIEDEKFKTLTATEKLYFWTVLSEFNIVDGEFYKSDMWFAAFLNLSLEKIRKARAKLAKGNWIKMVPGRKIRGRNLATTYQNVSGAEIVEGEQFIQIDRTTFYRLIDYVRWDRLKHEDVVSFVYINYFVKRKYGDGNSVLKSEFREISNMPQATASISRLHKTFRFKGDKELFTYEERYRSLYFGEIKTVMFEKGQVENREKEIDKKIDEIRAKASGIQAKDLAPLFDQLYKNWYDEDPVYSAENIKKLERLGEPFKVAAGLEKYFKSELSATTKKHSLPWFISNARKFM